MNKSQKLLTALTMAIALAGFTLRAPAAEREVVAYRLPGWKTIHFDDVRRADIHVQTVKRLGCEVKVDDHGGHVDVSYRCLEWQEISLDSHSQAHKWEDWLKASGFETRHQH
jgi:hypothetical protein